MKKSTILFVVCIAALILINQYERNEARKYYYNEGYRNEAIELLVKKEFQEPMTKKEYSELKAILED